jgi:high affinity Mn2+ porin
VRKRLISGLVVAVLSCVRTIAADGIVAMPVRESAAPYYDWTGYYVGSHFGYATGYSKWSATQAGAATPSLAGSLDFFKAFDGFKGAGSYFLGLQAGYSYMFPSRLVLGVEADVSFPNLLGGSQVISSDLIGQATYQELVEFSGTVRGRIGYAPGH